MKNISHVLKVRIIADLEDRVETEMSRNRMDRQKALAMIKKDDEARRQWSLKLYGVDTWDPSLYDLVLHIRKLTIDDAVDIICHTAKLSQFKTTPESQRAIDDLVIAARVKADLVDDDPRCDIRATAGLVNISLHSSSPLKAALEKKINSLPQRVEGVKDVKVHLVPSSIVE